MLELHEVVRHYRSAGEEVRAVDGVSLRVEPGEMVAIEGPSESLRNDSTVRESYLGARREGTTVGYAQHKHYRRRRRWLS